MCGLVKLAQVLLTQRKEIILTFPSQYCKNDLILNSHYFKKIRFCQSVF